MTCITFITSPWIKVCAINTVMVALIQSLLQSRWEAAIKLNKFRIYSSDFYLSLRLVKALRLPATPALLCSDRCADSRPPHDVTIFEFWPFFFLWPLFLLLLLLDPLKLYICREKQCRWRVILNKIHYDKQNYIKWKVSNQSNKTEM